MQQERPPAYAHEPDSLHLPSVPRHDPPSSERHLPGIKSLDLPNATPRAQNATLPSDPFELHLKPHTESQWQYASPLSHATFPQVPSTVPRTSTDVEIGSPMDTSSIMSTEEYQSRRALSVVSIDDPEVRLAAEALSGLGNPDFVRSPTSRSLTVPREHATEQEPLLNLITSNHPWIGGTINGSINAYTATKSYSPRFVKYGAELIERNIGSPMVSTVSSVGRRTGVERNIRRYLGEAGRRPSDLEQGDRAEHKRRRVGSPIKDEMLHEENLSPRTRATSQSSMTEPLPAYDDHRSPQYEETSTELTAPNREDEQSVAPQERRAWSTQLIMTTSGLGVALSESSLNSLKACLSLLRFATNHIDNVMQALKALLEEYEHAMRARQQSNGEGAGPANAESSTYTNLAPEKEDQVRALAEKMKNLGNDIMTTLQKVVASVSRYTGGALPQNASQVVRSQLLSVPQRWRVANRVSSEGRAGGEEVKGANKMLAFAKEGLDMMAQISTVIDGTVQSAESWLERMGRRRVEEGESSGQQVQGEKGGQTGGGMEGVVFTGDEKREKF